MRTIASAGKDGRPPPQQLPCELITTMLSEEHGEAEEATQEPKEAVEATEDIVVTEAAATPREGVEATGAVRIRTICSSQM